MTKKLRSRHALALFLALLAAGTVLAGKKPPADDPPPPVTIKYSITFLGTLGGSSSRSGLWSGGINEMGDVVGSSETEQFFTGIDGRIYPVIKPFVYHADTGTIHNLYDFFSPQDQAKWISFWPYGINSSGQIVGDGYKANAVGEFAVRITFQGTDEFGDIIPAVVEEVGPPGFQSTGPDINEFGDVTGTYTDGVNGTHGFVFTDENGAVDIGNLGGYTAPHDINNLGQISGTASDSDGKDRAFLYTPGVGIQSLGVIKASAFSDFSVGVELNDAGLVVGRSSAGTRKGWAMKHAFRHDGQGFQDLGTFGGSESTAFGVNSHGDVVGWAMNSNQEGVAYLYTDKTGMVPLESIIVNLPADTKCCKPLEMSPVSRQ